VTLLAASALSLLVALSPPPMPSPTFCAEWVKQSSEGYERLTLFSDRTLVWKTRRGEIENVRRKILDAEERKFYCDYFAKVEFWDLPDDMRSGLTGQFVSESMLRLARPDGSVKEIRFDELSSLAPAAATLRSSLEGLKRSFSERIAPVSRFTAATLSRGTLLKRFDGAVFRITLLDEARGLVELQGVSEPFSYFRKIEELRFFFEPPPEATR
jgi:hypothetical protein